MADKLDLTYGAQDLPQHDSGAYTGDISPDFLKKLGCSYALVGHSERRSIHGETDELVNAKLQAALRHDITPLLCIGEGLETRQAGEHVAYTLEQLHAALDGVDSAHVDDLVVAYESVWACGKGDVDGEPVVRDMGS